MLSKNMLMVSTVVMSMAGIVPAYAGSTSAADTSGTMATDDAMKSDANKLGDEIAVQYEEAKDFTFEQKEDFLAWVDEKSSQLGEKYDEVSERVGSDGEEAVEELAEAWDHASDELSSAFDNAKDASADTWEDVKANTVEALEDAKKTISDGKAAE
ncbi:MAG: histidinol dehydrogenase [Rhodospirillales bacterium]|nr:histidinol dehydrogenase [Rhodospirillales bacterium]